jgi:arsenate reductase
LRSGRGRGLPALAGPAHDRTLGVNDPAAAKGDEETRRKAFFRAYNELTTRISLFVNLPVEKLDRLTLQKRLDDIGKVGRATRVV